MFIKLFKELLKELFKNCCHKYSVDNKFNVGDFCLWDCGIEGYGKLVVQIQDYFKDYNKKTGEEFVYYEFMDIDKQNEYCGVKEDELSLLAYADEIKEMEIII